MQRRRSPFEDLEEAPFETRQPIRRPGILLEEAFEGGREVWERGRVGLKESFQAIGGRRAVRVPAALGEVVLGRRDELPSSEQRREFLCGELA